MVIYLRIERKSWPLDWMSETRKAVVAVSAVG